MNRLQKRCLLGSGALHLLLLVLLLVGSGFFVAQRPTETLQLINFIPDKLVDSPVVRGGNPKAKAQSPPAGPPPAPAPAPAARTMPEPPQPKTVEKAAAEPEKKPARKAAKPPKPSASEPEPALESGARKAPRPKRQIEVNLKPAPRPAATQRDEAAQAEAAAAQAQLRADARRSQVNSVLSGLQKLSTGTEVSMPGPGGESYASYKGFVQSIYYWAWQAPEDVADETAIVKARVTIARDGTIVRTEIVAKSGVAVVDKSVRAALDRVTSIGRPFPEGAKEEQRVFIINFNLKAKRSLG